MNAPDFDTKDLTKEKRLWDIYLASRCIPFSKFNSVTTLIVFILLILNAYLTNQELNEIIENVRKLADSGLSLSLSTLGFLVAGFTIFATVTQPKLSIKMAEIKHSVSGLSHLKHNYFVFLRVFIYYLSFSVFCLIIIMFGHKGGLVPTLIHNLDYFNCVKNILVKVTYVLLLTGYYFLVMQLKSFIFNTYHAVMTSLRWEAEGHE